MEYHAERSSSTEGRVGLGQGSSYRWMLTAEENRLMMRLRGMPDGMHLVTVRKVEGRVEGIAVLSAREEGVGG